MKRLLILCVAAMIIGLSLLISLARADDPSTTYTGGDWLDPNSWTAGVPDYNTVAIIPVDCVVDEWYCKAKRVELDDAVSLSVVLSLYVKERIDFGQNSLVYVGAFARLLCPRLEGDGALSLDGGMIYTNYIDGLSVSLNPNGGVWQRIIHCPPF